MVDLLSIPPTPVPSWIISTQNRILKIHSTRSVIGNYAEQNHNALQWRQNQFKFKIARPSSHGSWLRSSWLNSTKERARITVSVPRNVAIQPPIHASHRAPVCWANSLVEKNRDRCKGYSSAEDAAALPGAPRAPPPSVFRRCV